ncbi:MAG: lipoprotein [Gammaproteobacteria bacterium]
MIAIILVFLSACGQKGPLYLPEDKPHRDAISLPR